MRLLYPAVGLCVLVLASVGCSPTASTPVETMLSMPESPQPTATAPVTPGATPGSTSDGTSGAGSEEEAAADPSEHCVMVAGGMTTAMLAPLSLRSESDPEELTELRQQILDLRGKVPADLHDDFTVLADSVEAPPRGSGTFDESSFREAMVPVADWLSRHCARS